MNKICKICNKSKKLSKFYFRKDSNSYRNECKLCQLQLKKDYYKRNPWLQIYTWINTRCNNKFDKNYKKYGLKGIKNYLSKNDIKFLWFRDKAYLMKKPSIDRKDNDGHYELFNCRFIELSLNSKKDKFKKIHQFTINGRFLKSWKSLKEASINLKISSGNICSVLKGNRKHTNGFVWKYANE